jgi:hypothetical protein
LGAEIVGIWRLELDGAGIGGESSEAGMGEVRSPVIADGAALPTPEIGISGSAYHTTEVLGRTPRTRGPKQ